MAADDVIAKARRLPSGAAEARPCNGLVKGWPEIARLAGDGGKPKVEQVAMFGEPEE
jgi:hypothetical protein